MRYFIDTEFFEDGPTKPIQLISVGIVAEDGRELYLENRDFDWSQASDWLKENVKPHLTGQVMSYGRFGPIVKDFIQTPAGMMTKPEFWGYYSDYDWVVFCQMFGRMIDLPKGFPMYCRDLKQWADQLGVQKTEFPAQSETEHHALNDARWNLELYRFLKKQQGVRGAQPNFVL